MLRPALDRASGDTGQFRLGRGAGRGPAGNRFAPQARTLICVRSAGRPEAGAFAARRARPIRRVGELAASPKPKVRLAAKEETRQAAKALLAAANAPGPREASLVPTQ